MDIGSYQVLFELGHGGMGTVYLGRVRGSGDFERLVAIKRQRPSRHGAEEPPERFLTEARLAGLVHHANVVGMHQAGVDDDGYYFVCDYVEGPSLAGLTARSVEDELWPVAIVTRVMLDALAGLQAVHDAADAEGRPLGMLHRDVAVDNLLVGRDGVTRLADFGIAKSSRNPLRTEAGQIRGKLPYLAPEYLRGEAVDKTFDIYAAGITLWVALVGELPWGNCSELRMIVAIQDEGVPPLSRPNRSFAPELEAVVARACHRDPRERFQSARELLNALQAAVSSSSSIASHIQVAEYVERVSGAELARRRERIQARRRELEQEAPQVDLPAELTLTEHAPRTVTMQGLSPAAQGESASYPSEEVRLPISRTLPRIVSVGALLFLTLVAYVMLKRSVPAVPAQGAAQVVADTSSKPAVDAARASSLPASKLSDSVASDAAPDSGTTDRAPVSASDEGLPPIVPKSPERARSKTRTGAREISTKNPYRRTPN